MLILARVGDHIRKRDREGGEMIKPDSMPLMRPGAGYLYTIVVYDDTSILCAKVS